MQYTRHITNIDYLKRVAAHVAAENDARAGYPYPDRDKESQWVRENLPQTFEDFYAVLIHIQRRNSWALLPQELAALLLGTFTHSSECSPGGSSVCDASGIDVNHYARIWRVKRSDEPITWGLKCTPMYDRQLLLALLADLSLSEYSPAIAGRVSRTLALLGHPYAPRIASGGYNKHRELWTYMRDNHIFHGTLDDSADSAWGLFMAPQQQSESIHFRDGKWWFWDECQADEYGPFDTEDEARKELDAYCQAFEIGPDPGVNHTQQELSKKAGK